MPYNGYQLEKFKEDTFRPSIFSADDTNLLIDIHNLLLKSEIRIGSNAAVIISDRNFIWQIPKAFTTGGGTVPTDEDDEDADIGEGVDDDVYVIRKFPDGHLYVGGKFALANAMSRTHLASFRQNLSLRTPSWFIGPQKDGTIPGPVDINAIVRDIAQRTNNLFYCVGDFIQSSAGDEADPVTGTVEINLYTPACNLVLLSLNGRVVLEPLDWNPPVFNTRDFPTNANIKAARLLACQTANYLGATDAVLVGGNFDEVGSTETHGLVVLKNDGTVYSGFSAGTGFQFKTNEDVTPGIINFGVEHILPSTVNGGWYVSQHRYGGSLGAVAGVGTDTTPCDPDIGIHPYNYYDSIETYGGLVRIDGDGSLDTDFQPGGNSLDCDKDFWGLHFDLFTNAFHALCEDGDGNVYIGNLKVDDDETTGNNGGWLDLASQTYLRRYFMKLGPDGSLDTSFRGGEYYTPVATLTPSIEGGSVLCAAIDSQGRVIIGGTFASISGVSRGGIARYTTAGVLDTTFPNLDVSGGAPFIGSIVVNQGDVYCIGGNFTQLSDPVLGVVARNNIALVSSTGRIL